MTVQLPTYSPNLNLIERLWKFVKKQCLYVFTGVSKGCGSTVSNKKGTSDNRAVPNKK
jgi:hypothetical protein